MYSFYAMYMFWLYSFIYQVLYLLQYLIDSCLSRDGSDFNLLFKNCLMIILYFFLLLFTLKIWGKSMRNEERWQEGGEQIKKNVWKQNFKSGNQLKIIFGFGFSTCIHWFHSCSTGVFARPSLSLCNFVLISTCIRLCKLYWFLLFGLHANWAMKIQQGQVMGGGEKQFINPCYYPWKRWHSVPFYFFNKWY